MDTGTLIILVALANLLVGFWVGKTRVNEPLRNMLEILNRQIHEKNDELHDLRQRIKRLEQPIPPSPPPAKDKWPRAKGTPLEAAQRAPAPKPKATKPQVVERSAGYSKTSEYESAPLGMALPLVVSIAAVADSQTGDFFTPSDDSHSHSCRDSSSTSHHSETSSGSYDSGCSETSSGSYDSGCSDSGGGGGSCGSCD